MSDFKDKNVLITGGASGIGRIMGRLALERGARLVIWDISQANIDRTLSEFKNYSSVQTYLVDVSDVLQIEKTAQQVQAQIGTIDILINNAGIVIGKYFNAHSLKDITKTMDINATAPMTVTHSFLPAMIAQNAGHICNIASSGGLVSNPKMSVYAASKWALVGWSDSLRIEMLQLNKKVKVTTIMPYYINTGMFDGVQSKIPILQPEKAALTIIKAIENDKKMISLPGYIYRLTRFTQAILPIRWLDYVMDKVLGIYKTMEHFTGRK